jgi:hypothetical protein
MTLRAFFFAPLILLAATADQFTSGVWQGNANYDEEGYFSDCTMTAQAERDILLGFVMSKDLDWGLVIADETRNFKVGTRKAVLLIVDDGEPMPAIAKVVDVHGILIPLKSSDAVLDAMRHGKVLRIASDQTEFSFQLTGTRDAIAALAQCVTEHQGTNRLEL